jgi:hypothetical protein
MVDLRGCLRITDVGESALGHGCGQLHNINLYGCRNQSQTSVYQHWGMDVVSYITLISMVVVASQTSVYQHWGMDVVSYITLISMVVVASQTSVYQH